ncbi:CHAT domain-containing protein, partial [Arthrospira platensis SPKY1]|nr:CHAT domain-containing protein [Arthrospira platensis SPKY1]
MQAHQLPIAVLNACQSGKQVGAQETSLGSRLMAAGVQLVVAMGYSVTVSAAALLMQTLYGALLDGQPLAQAIRRGRLALYNDKGRRAAYDQTIQLEDWLL